MYHKEVDVDWIHLAEDRDQWQMVVNVIMSLWASQKAENDLLPTCQDGP
jgi:hypothetical protein